MPVGGRPTPVQQSGGRQCEYAGAHGAHRRSPTVTARHPGIHFRRGGIRNRQMRRDDDEIGWAHVGQRLVSPGLDTAMRPNRTTIDADNLGFKQRHAVVLLYGPVPEIGNREGIDQTGDARKKAPIGGQKSDTGHFFLLVNRALRQCLQGFRCRCSGFRNNLGFSVQVSEIGFALHYCCSLTPDTRNLTPTLRFQVSVFRCQALNSPWIPALP